MLVAAVFRFYYLAYCGLGGVLFEVGAAAWLQQGGVAKLVDVEVHLGGVFGVQRLTGQIPT